MNPVEFLLRPKVKRGLLVFGLILLLGIILYRTLYPRIFESYVGKVNAPLIYDSSRTLSADEFEAIAQALSEQARRQKAEAIVSEEQDPFARRIKIEILMNTESFIRDSEPRHIKYFRNAGIRRYEGPKTCLQCHQTIAIEHPDGMHSQVETLEDVVNSVHFRFQSSSGGFSTYGYDGRQVNAGPRKIAVGKINRACGIPGSFSWTGWAVLITSRPEHAAGPILRSEGCGQCHIGGNYQPATEKMLPFSDVPQTAKEGIDCLICHAAVYDMNRRVVIEDRYGLRWDQDRSLKAALSVGPIRSEQCLRCHQHNLGGDAYAYNQAAQALGDRHQRILHQGAKRGSPFSPHDDVHAAAGLECTDCHRPEGHKIPRGRMGVDLVANDLPDKEVSCETCHGRAPHNASPDKALLNGHIARLACETCHIPRLEPNSVVLRDWVHPTWNPKEGIWEPTDIYRSGEPGKGLIYLWFNGNGTFLANALGSHPDGSETYHPLMNQLVRITDPEAIAAIRTKAIELKGRYPDIDVERYVRLATDPLSQLTPELIERRRAMIENNLRPAMNEGQSRIYPFKIFNALMYEDLNNQGPFGAMILPFDYKVYYESGDTLASLKRAIQDPIVQRMYQEPFKLYMMDEFMAYFGVEGGWKARYPLVGDRLLDVEPRWMRQMGTLMVNHGIRRQGHGCADCHAPNGVMDFAAIGYSPARVAELQDLKQLTAGANPSITNYAR
ncbi:nitrite reductase [Caldichromatium japonicum]|uniref:Nitrite reductase n=1 Tax=Caldichromatium japonicum TaxID=2699430 RepID=A0A6G7VD36_9GAMM|nr:multiheme c-type cytochrome [Caldichromatium japonicum]QIK37931.1 nitrite reductase [Caldichromatium japonicum]